MKLWCSVNPTGYCAAALSRGVDLMKCGDAGACVVFLKYLNSIDRIENILTTELGNYE